MAVPHGLLDLGSARNAHIAQRPVIELGQGFDGLLDLPFPAPIGPERSCVVIKRR
jgi:hypothetical protein